MVRAPYRRVAAILLLSLAILTGCAAGVPGGGPVRLGQIAAISGPSIRPDRVIEDSRCPSNTQCVWAGRLIVRATVMGGGWSRQLDLTLGMPVHVADGSLTLVAVTPVPRANDQGGTSPPYRFTFAFKGGR